MEEKEIIKKQIIVELLIDKLYGCIELENGKITFDKYDINGKELLFLLKQYDNEKFDAICDLLKVGEDN